jgi:hypothetical protein
MKTFLYFLLLTLAAEFSVAQTTHFNKRLPFNQTRLDLGSSLVDVATGYMLSGTTVDSSTGIYDRIFIGFVDSSGHFNWRKSYGKLGYSYDPGGPGSLISTTDSNFVQVGYVKHDTITLDDVLLIKYNKHGDTIWTRRYIDTTDAFGVQCKQTQDKGFIIAGINERKSRNWIPEVLLIKTDSLGNIQWKKTFYTPGVKQPAISIDICPDKGFIIGGLHNNQALLIRTDSLGNFVWQNSYGNSPYYVCGAVVSCTSDGNYIFGSCFSDSVVGPHHYDQSYIVRVASDGSQLWAKKYGPARVATGIGIVHELQDGSFVSAGQTTNTTSNHAYGILVKTAPNGDSLWFHRYDFLKAPNSLNYLVDFKPTRDSGFVAVGYLIPASPDIGNEDTWLLKVNKYGCDSIGCQNIVAMGIQEFSDNKGSFVLFPNPANDFVSISYSFPLTVKDVFLNIYDQRGKALKSILVLKENKSQEIGIANLSSGLYFCQLMADGTPIASLKLSIVK